MKAGCVIGAGWVGALKYPLVELFLLTREEIKFYRGRNFNSGWPHHSESFVSLITHTKREICSDSLDSFAVSFEFIFSHVESSEIKEAPDVVLHPQPFTISFAISWHCWESDSEWRSFSEELKYCTQSDGLEFHGMWSIHTSPVRANKETRHTAEPQH